MSEIGTHIIVERKQSTNQIEKSFAKFYLGLLTNVAAVNVYRELG